MKTWFANTLLKISWMEMQQYIMKSNLIVSTAVVGFEPRILFILIDCGAKAQPLDQPGWVKSKSWSKVHMFNRKIFFCLHKNIKFC